MIEWETTVSVDWKSRYFDNRPVAEFYLRRMQLVAHMYNERG